MLGAVEGSVLGGMLKPDVAALIADWKQEVRDAKEMLKQKNISATAVESLRAWIESKEHDIAKMVGDPANFQEDSPIKPEGVTPGLINPYGTAAQQTNMPVQMQSGATGYVKPKPGGGDARPSGFGLTAAQIANMVAKGGGGLSFSPFATNKPTDDEDKPPITQPKKSGGIPWLLLGLAAGAIYLARK